MRPFRRTEGDEQPAARPGPLGRFHSALLRRLLICWLLFGAVVGTFGFLSMFDRRSTPEQLGTAAIFGGLAVFCIAVLAIWLRIAMRRSERDQA